MYATMTDQSGFTEAVARLGKLFTNRFWLWRSAMQTKAVPALASWSRPAVAARGQLPGLAGH